MNNLLTILAVMIVPIIPTYFLFKKLNSRATLKGKIDATLLKEVEFSMGGALAGYYLIAAGALIYLEWKRTHPVDEVWQVQGALKFADQDAELSITNVQAYFTPPSYQPLADGHFDMHIVVPVKHDRPEFPSITFQHPRYRPAVLHLSPQQIDDELKIITVSDTIILKKAL
jgi:hypothetical protein